MGGGPDQVSVASAARAAEEALQEYATAGRACFTVPERRRPTTDEVPRNAMDPGPYALPSKPDHSERLLHNDH
ncbi:hypothetical protein ACFYQ5_03390 [Streptomyces sp. NPDC005794]|uniref:hypothetical protein n=1 Tax=Streptomyces sp. NPDC005794 TaxID=3364733 RepID=UPI0036A95FDB